MAETKKQHESPSLYGVVTVGERGQVVIPAEARKDLAVRPGDKLVVFAHPYRGGLVLFKTEQVESLLEQTLEGLSRIKEETAEQAE